MFKNFFLWCSGTDDQTLKMVQERDRKSVGYQVIYGALVLVPAIMAFVGMSHATSNFSENRLVWIIGGLIFSSMIFSFDRFIVQTYKKGNNRLFWARITISIPLGFIISLFGILLAFHKEIDKQIKENSDKKLSNIETVYLQKEDSLRSKIIDLQSDIKCLEKLKTYEQAGKDTILPCGASSKHHGQRERFNELNRQIDEKKTEITKEEDRIKNAINRIETLRDNEKRGINSKLGKDPLTELLALFHVIDKHKIGIIFTIGLFALLMVLDLFPVFAKALTSETLYDRVYRSDETSKINLSKFLEKTQNEFDNHTPAPIQKPPPDELIQNRHVIIPGIIAGSIIAPILIIFRITDLTTKTAVPSLLVSTILSIPISIGTGYVSNILTNYFNRKKNKKNE